MPMFLRLFGEHGFETLQVNFNEFTLRDGELPRFSTTEQVRPLTTAEMREVEHLQKLYPEAEVTGGFGPVKETRGGSNIYHQFVPAPQS